eukprot:TRINITY_DN9094_c0_g1_i2.p2 TRINITY_DN9094_c0_g1~~TRINITY_DN9094_c0_g1_i2.p2  ORF type:complete len:334 (-),score=53.46 TRINITY_DN9094_c0_g1_i2:129-986(-)
MCIRDRYQRRVHGKQKGSKMGCCTADREKEQDVELKVADQIVLEAAREETIEQDLEDTKKFEGRSDGNFQSKPAVGTAPMTGDYKQLAEAHPKLKLTVEESTVLTTGTSFLIHSYGYELSFRGVHDSCVHIGTKAIPEGTNDIVVPEESGFGTEHLYIYYNEERKEYLLRDKGNGNGTFLSINKPFPLKNGHIVTFGESSLVIILDDKDQLHLKFIDGPRADQKFSFSPKEGPARIGRMSDCEVRFDEPSVSRYQSNFFFKDNTWFIEDGWAKKPEHERNLALYK